MHRIIHLEAKFPKGKSLLSPTKLDGYQRPNTLPCRQPPSSQVPKAIYAIQESKTCIQRLKTPEPMPPQR